jgi:hypothetical protein
MRATVATAPGRPDHPNEDWAAVTPAGVAVVLDGLSESGDTGCVHGTAWYARQLGARLLTLATDVDRALVDALAGAIDDVRPMHGGRCDLRHPASPGATVAVVREHAIGWEYLVLSDAIVVIDTAAQPTVVTDRRVTDHLAAPGTGWADLIRHLQEVRNRPGGYWVAQVDPDAAGYALTGTVDTTGSAILLSDGAALTVTDFDALSWRGLVDLAEARGPDALIAVTRELELRDPDGRVWPRYKTHDDATAVVCRHDRVRPA